MRAIILVLIILLLATSVLSTLRIASVQPLTSNLTAAKTSRDGEILWEELVNARGGIEINGTMHQVEIISIDVGARTTSEMKVKVVDAVRAVANGTYGIIHAMFAPYSSALTEVHAIEAEKHQILSCSSGMSTLSQSQISSIQYSLKYLYWERLNRI